MINYTSWPIILQNMKAIVPTTLSCIHKVKRDRWTDKVKYYITLILSHAGHKNNLTIYIGPKAFIFSRLIGHDV
jgi:hypothetical protein